MNTIKKYAKPLGIVLATIFVILAWSYGFLSGIFYLFGLYAAVYLLSILFKTTKILEFILGSGFILLYISVAILDLFLLYLALKFMFESSFFWGFLIIIIGFPIITPLSYFLFMGIGFIIGSPLIYFLEDLEKRFVVEKEEVKVYE